MPRTSVPDGDLKMRLFKINESAELKQDKVVLCEPPLSRRHLGTKFLQSSEIDLINLDFYFRSKSCGGVGCVLGDLRMDREILPIEGEANRRLARCQVHGTSLLRYHYLICPKNDRF